MALPTLYTADEVAIKLKVSRRSVYLWLATGQLTGLRVGQGWRVTEEDLIEFMNRRHGAVQDVDPYKDPQDP
jgi:excisionase family DNA binding protein